MTTVDIERAVRWGAFGLPVVAAVSFLELRRRSRGKGKSQPWSPGSPKLCFTVWMGIFAVLSIQASMLNDTWTEFKSEAWPFAPAAGCVLLLVIDVAIELARRRDPERLQWTIRPLRVLWAVACTLALIIFVADLIIMWLFGEVHLFG